VSAAPAQASPRSGIPRALIFFGLAACAAGLVAHRLGSAVPVARVAEFAAIAGLVALPAWALVAGRGMRWATALAIMWAVAMLVMVGVLPVLATALSVLGLIALGGVVSRRAHPALAMVVGAGILAGIGGWLLPLPVHSPFVYAPVLVALVAWRRADVSVGLERMRRGWHRAVDADPRGAAWAVVALGVGSTGTWLPTLQFDDLAYHLALPWQLMQNGRYALDPTHQISALAPWAGDILQAVPQVIAGAEARGAMNTAWLAAIAILGWSLSRRIGLDVRGRWLVLALLGTLPLLPALLAGMHTELPATAATLALAGIAVDPRTGSVRDVYLLAVVSALLLALKLTHPVAAAPLALAAAWRLRGVLADRPMHGVGALLAGMLLAGSSYAYAHHVTGNPVFPFFNATFRSAYFAPVDLRDARWQGDGALSIWQLTFDTSRYAEAWDGGFGFVPIALGGAVLVALTQRRARVLAVCGLLAFAGMLALVPYARYAFPGLVLLLPPAVHALRTHLARPTATRVVALVAALNFAFMPNAHWLLHTGGPKRALLSGGLDAPLLTRFAAERVVNARIRGERRAARVLDFQGATHAELAGAGRTTTWYAPRLHAAARAADRDPTGGAWSRLLEDERITDVVVRRAGLPEARTAGLVRRGAYRVLTVDDVEWWRIPDPNSR
jgi:hypothetical protein